MWDNSVPVCWRLDLCLFASNLPVRLTCHSQVSTGTAIFIRRCAAVRCWLSRRIRMYRPLPKNWLRPRRRTMLGFWRSCTIRGISDPWSRLRWTGSRHPQSRRYHHPVRFNVRSSTLIRGPNLPLPRPEFRQSPPALNCPTAMPLVKLRG